MSATKCLIGRAPPNIEWLTPFRLFSSQNLARDPAQSKGKQGSDQHEPCPRNLGQCDLMTRKSKGYRCGLPPQKQIRREAADHADNCSCFSYSLAQGPGKKDSQERPVSDGRDRKAYFDHMAAAPRHPRQDEQHKRPEDRHDARSDDALSLTCLRSPLQIQIDDAA